MRWFLIESVESILLGQDPEVAGFIIKTKEEVVYPGRFFFKVCLIRGGFSFLGDEGISLVYMWGF